MCRLSYSGILNSTLTLRVWRRKSKTNNAHCFHNYICDIIIIIIIIIIVVVVVFLSIVRPQKEILWITLPDIFVLLLQFPFKVQADPRIRLFSIRGLPRPEKNWKIKGINGS